MLPFIVFYVILILLFRFFLSLEKISVQYKGNVGEQIVAAQLRELPGEKYMVLNDILLQTERGSVQIDHIVISVYGIFVIETKNYKGWIHGNEKSEYWTQSIYPHKTKFRNPIKQNWSHVYPLKALFRDFKNTAYHRSSFPVIYPNQLISAITSRTPDSQSARGASTNNDRQTEQRQNAKQGGNDQSYPSGSISYPRPEKIRDTGNLSKVQREFSRAERTVRKILWLYRISPMQVYETDIPVVTELQIFLILSP